MPVQHRHRLIRLFIDDLQTATVYLTEIEKADLRKIRFVRAYLFKWVV